MKRFQFKLDSVLSHRKLLEEAEQQKLLQIDQAILTAQQQRDKIQSEAAGYRQIMSKQMPGAIDVEEIRHLSLYLDKLDRDLIQISQLILKLEEKHRIQVEKLIQAKKKREVIEKLKERRFDSFENEVKGMEQKLLDELTVVQFKHPGEQNLPVKKSNT